MTSYPCCVFGSSDPVRDLIHEGSWLTFSGGSVVCVVVGIFHIYGHVIEAPAATSSGELFDELRVGFLRAPTAMGDVCMRCKFKGIPFCAWFKGERKATTPFGVFLH